MTPRRRAGFTLIEMVVALGLLGIVGATILRLLLQQRWTVQAQTERAGVQGALLAGLLYLQGELRELGHDDNGADILVAAAESLSYRAMRGGGVACGVGPTGIGLDPAFSYGYRQPQAGRDSMLLFVEGDPTFTADDRWLHMPVLSISAGTCAGAGAMVVGTVLDTAVAPLAENSPSL